MYKIGERPMLPYGGCPFAGASASPYRLVRLNPIMGNPVMDFDLINQIISLFQFHMVRLKPDSGAKII